MSSLQGVTGEGLDGLREEMNHRFHQLEQKLDSHLDQNRQEHQQIMEMIKKLGKEVQVEI